MVIKAKMPGSRPRKRLRKPSDPMADFAARREKVAGESAKGMFQKLMMLRKLLGERPYRGRAVSDQELEDRFIAVRHDREAMKQVIAENVRVKDGGAVLVSREFVNSMIKTEDKMRKGGLL